MSAATTRTIPAVLLAVALAFAFVVVPPQPAGADSSEPNDPLWEDQWGPQQVRAHHAWATTTG